MLILSFETSAKACSVALLQDGKLLGESYQNTGLTHSQTLMQMTEDLLSQCQLSVDSISAVAVASGPGSFTGVRIGVAAAKGFAWGRNLPCYGISTLEAMAISLGLYSGYICAVMDARRNQVYNALFHVVQGKVERICEDRAISVADLVEDAKKIPENLFLVGDGSTLCYNTMLESVPNLVLPPEYHMHQRAIGVGVAAWQFYQQGIYPDGKDLTPNYLRMSQAERERAAREQNKEKEN